MNDNIKWWYSWPVIFISAIIFCPITIVLIILRIKNDKGKIKEVVILDSYKPNEPFTKSYGQFINEMEVFGFTRVTKKDE